MAYVGSEQLAQGDNIFDPPAPAPAPLPPKAKKLKWWVWLLIAIGIVAIIGSTVVAVLLCKKKSGKVQA